VIVLEDLSVQGFATVCAPDDNLDTTKMIFHRLAIFHAASFFLADSVRTTKFVYLTARINNRPSYHYFRPFVSCLLTHLYISSLVPQSFIITTSCHTDVYPHILTCVHERAGESGRVLFPKGNQALCVAPMREINFIFCS
jgi:hypothetical protein